MTSRGYVLTTCLLLLAAVPLAADADTIHVPLDQPTIQQGLDAAASGDIVLVSAGTYTGGLNRDLDFGGKNVTLRSESGQPTTIIDCETLGRALYFHSGEDTTAIVEGFTIQNAVADSGGAVMCRSGSSPVFVQCTFRNNSAVMQGGAICARLSSPILRFCLFEENAASGGSQSTGGAVACLNAAGPRIRGCTFSGNTAAAYAGAVYGSASALTISGCSFSDNAGLFGGGGIFCSNCPSLAVTGCQFSGNTGSQGGAIYTQSCPPTVTDCSFDGHGQRAVALLYPVSDGHFSNCTFVNSIGHVHCFDGADATFSNCTFVGSTWGGTVSMNEASPSFDHCIFAFSTDEQVATCESGTETPVFTRCVLFSNTGGDDLCGAVSDTLHRDPRFCNMTEYEFDLCANSVCAPANNAWNELIGAWDAGCPDCGSAAARTTWGAIKGLYR